MDWRRKLDYRTDWEIVPSTLANDEPRPRNLNPLHRSRPPLRPPLHSFQRKRNPIPTPTKRQNPDVVRLVSPTSTLDPLSLPPPLLLLLLRRQRSEIPLRRRKTPSTLLEFLAASPSTVHYQQCTVPTVPTPSPSRRTSQSSQPAQQSPVPPA